MVENQLVNYRGGGKPPTSFFLCKMHKNSAARTRSQRAEFPLYHTVHKMSIGKLHKFLSNLFPEFVQFDENFFQKNY